MAKLKRAPQRSHARPGDLIITSPGYLRDRNVFHYDIFSLVSNRNRFRTNVQHRRTWLDTALGQGVGALVGSDRTSLPCRKAQARAFTAPFQCRTATSSRCRAFAVLERLERKGRRKPPLPVLVPFNSKRMGWRRFLPRISP